jgi:hypothetical protein
MFSSLAVGSWLGIALAVVLVVQFAAVILVWSVAAVVALVARDGKRAERALELFRIMWSSRSKR